MSLENLTKEEQDIIYQCLNASVEGPFFPEEEFHTTFGIHRREVKEILKSWPNLSEADGIVSLALNNVMNNLLGYPHGQERVWGDYISVSPEKVALIFQKWRSR